MSDEKNNQAVKLGKKNKSKHQSFTPIEEDTIPEEEELGEEIETLQSQKSDLSYPQDKIAH